MILCVPQTRIDGQVELQFHGSADVDEKDAIFNYRRKYLPTQQVRMLVGYTNSTGVAFNTIFFGFEGAWLATTSK